MGVRLGIVNRDFERHVAKIDTMIALGKVQGIGGRVAVDIEPCLSVKAGGIDHQIIALPMANGIAGPGGIRDPWEAGGHPERFRGGERPHTA